MVKVLFVCLGNICRSPTAHGVFRQLVQDAGLGDCIEIDSAGTAAWHSGKPVDARSAAHAQKRGYDLSDLRARQVQAHDFNEYDYVLAMDAQNLADLKALEPEAYRGHLGLMLDFSEQSAYREVPDPYYEGSDGFELVLDLIEDASRGLLSAIRAEHLS